MKYFLLCLLLCTTFIGHGQSLENLPEDTSTINQLLRSANVYNFSNADSGLVVAEQALQMARNLHYKKGEADALHTVGESYDLMGDFPEALKMQFAALRIDKEIHSAAREAETLGYIGILYIQLGEYREAIQYLVPGEKIGQSLGDVVNSSFVLSNMGDVYDYLKMPDSALYYQRKAYAYFSRLSRPHLRSFILRHMGNIYAEFGKTDSALQFYSAGILNCRLFKDNINMSMIQKQMSMLYQSIHRDDSALYYARQAYVNARIANSKPQALDASNLLAAWYRKSKNPDSAFFYTDIAATIKDSLYGPEKFRQLQRLVLAEQEHQQTIIQQEEDSKNKIKYIVLLFALFMFLLLAFILFRNNRLKQKANNLLQTQKTRVEQTLTELKSTQATLIQREKMASLGELTAGIAHEIQNPLNFVNNFSDVNTELIEEVEQEMDKGNIAEVKTILNDIKENEQKINHHGKRADAIVKGMLQHSRSSTGQNELTDINALADEYLRLAYHRLRAKNNSFNATMKTDFDNTIGKINIIPQDIGRVLLNLYNNAFYALAEKSKQHPNWHEPVISVTTKKINDKVVLTVMDNGNGIPQKVIDKIFQPFFTTKPTGQGTGLGLSLSYDIIKAHSGEIKVNTKENEGSEFIIELPLK